MKDNSVHHCVTIFKMQYLLVAAALIALSYEGVIEVRI